MGVVGLLTKFVLTTLKPLKSAVRRIASVGSAPRGVEAAARALGDRAAQARHRMAHIIYPAYAGGSPSAARIISDETMLRIIREYRARGGSAVESMRISDPAKHRLREIIEANVVAALHQAKKKGGAASAQKLTGAAVSKLAASWTLRVISR